MSNVVPLSNRGRPRIQIRAAIENDWPTVRNLVIASLEETTQSSTSYFVLEEKRITPGQWRARINNSAFFIAFDREEPVGIAGTAKGYRNHPAEREVISLWIAPRLRGSQCASLLIDAIKQRALNDEVNNLHLCLDHNDIRAKSFYTSKGFVPDPAPRYSDPDQPITIRELICPITRP